MAADLTPDFEVRSRVLHAVVSFGERYRREYLNYPHLKGESLERDWWSGLQLFLDHSFYQGRKDEVSAMVQQAAMPVLNNYFEHQDSGRIGFTDFKQLSADLGAKIGKGKVGKARDIEMLLSIFEFVSKLPKGNLTLYSLERFREGKVEDHFRELQGIRQIGPKVASIYLRDLVCIYDLHEFLQLDDLKFLQPIDVWVRRVAHRLAIIPAETCSDDEVRAHIVDTCRLHNVSAFKFNQGAWYLGKNSFDILIEQLDRVKFDGQE
jgi:hypothetical protein